MRDEPGRGRVVLDEDGSDRLAAQRRDVGDRQCLGARERRPSPARRVVEAALVEDLARTTLADLVRETAVAV